MSKDFRDLRWYAPPPRMVNPALVVYNFGRVCLSVCMCVRMYVCQTITFGSIDVKSSFSQFRYTGQVRRAIMNVIGSTAKVKVTAAKRLQMPVPAMIDFDW